MVADLSPGGVQTLVECIRNLEGGGRVALIGANPEPLNLPVRYLMIRSIEICSITGRHYIDFPELLELARRGVIDTRHVTTRFFPLEQRSMTPSIISPSAATMSRCGRCTRPISEVARMGVV